MLREAAFMSGLGAVARILYFCTLDRSAMIDVGTFFFCWPFYRAHACVQGECVLVGCGGEGVPLLMPRPLCCWRPL